MELIYLSKLRTRLLVVRMAVIFILSLPFVLCFLLSIYLPQQLVEQEPGIQFAILFSVFILLALGALQLTERAASSLRFLVLEALLQDLNTHLESELVLTAYAPMVIKHISLETRMEVSYQLEIAPPRLLWNRGSTKEHICKELDSGLWKRMLGYTNSP